MIEKIALPQNAPLFRQASPERGLFRPHTEITENFRFGQPQVSVDTLSNGEGNPPITMVRIEPEMDGLTRDILNRRMEMEEKIEGASRLFSIISTGLPTAFIAVDGGVHFWSEGSRVGGLNNAKGFWIAKDYLSGDPDIIGHKIQRPETAHKGGELPSNSFEMYRKQDVSAFEDEHKRRMSVLFTASFSTAAVANFEELNAYVKHWLNDDSRRDEDLRKLVNAQITVRLKAPFGGEGGDGQVVGFTNPDTDSGGGVFIR